MFQKVFTAELFTSNSDSMSKAMFPFHVSPAFVVVFPKQVRNNNGPPVDSFNPFWG